MKAILTIPAVCALGVGGYYAYIRNAYMPGIEQIKPMTQTPVFLIDRTLDSDCFEGKRLSVGVWGSNQGIRIGDDGAIHWLHGIRKTEKGYLYIFEKGVKLEVYKKDSKLCYKLVGGSENLNVEKEIQVDYKPIGVASAELDKILEIK